MVAALFSACRMFESLTESDSEEEHLPAITNMAFSKTSLSMKAGTMDYLALRVNPSSQQAEYSFSWSYDKEVISCEVSNFGVTITALKEGQTSLLCKYKNRETACIVTVSGTAEDYGTTTEPYIYSNYSIIQTSPGVSEKVFVSLYGGDASDINGYSWSIDNPSVASIQPTGQYCVITAKDSGYARIKVTHSKASYPYYIGIYVFADATNVTYITTSDNIVTMNQDDGERTVNVSLVNGKDSSLDSQFTWEIINEDENSVPVSLNWNGSNAVISPKQSGSCTVRVTHPDAAYPLDILCRVITVIKNVYIQPDSTVVKLNGTASQTVKAELMNISNGNYDIDGFKYILDDYSVAEIVSSVGNTVEVRGIANGSCKLIISHERSQYSREVLLIVTGQLKDAVDASCYITTSQNYIRTKVGADGQTVSISLKGGDEGDESKFQWNVTSKAADGSSGKVISLDTACGEVLHTSARSAAPTYSYGTAFLEPLCEGTAVISITHPKIVYPTEILVKVLGKDAVIEEPMYFSGSGLIKMLNGESQDYTVQLRGSNYSGGEEQNINWEVDNSKISINSSGNTAHLTAPSKGSGCTTSKMTVSHRKVDNNKSVLILTADDEETLSTMKALYADKLYYNIEIGDEATVMVSHAGFDTYDEETDKTTAYDFSRMSWTVKDPSVISVSKNTSNPLLCSIKALKSGQTTLTASIDSYSCDFSILVYPEGAVNIEPEVYFTTTQNVVALGGKGKTARVSINAIHLSTSEYASIKWTSEDKSICSIAENGTSAVITALKEGETVIKVNHPKSQNELKIYIRVGSEYVIPEAEPLVYISSPDVLSLLKGEAAQSLQAILVNYEGSNSSGFSFSIDNEAVAKITAQTATGIAYIKPVDSGQTEITISHNATNITKKVLVLVGNSEEELAGYVYLSTNSNVVSVGEGNTKSVSVSVKNAASPVIDGYTWTSSNPSIIDVTSSGSTAVLKGNGIGTAIITVKNKTCLYPLSIIAQCVDPIAASANPYIQLSSSVLTLTVNSSFTSLTADLVGGTESDRSEFNWSVKDSSVCAVYGQNEVGKIRALKGGQTYVTVSHPKAAYSAQLLVICEEEKTTDCYISVPSSIMTIKPNASPQTITANLVNGTSTDKYNFSWSLDVYDVIDFQYSANVCTITPKQTGSATITISHPKAAYNQQIIVNVQEYSSFAFPQNSMTLTQGTVSFQNMQVPTTSVTTHVEYSVDNEAICSISGTKTVAQITGIVSGTTTVRAKLVATSTGVKQAESEMLVYVKEAPTNNVFITSSSTIYTVQKGKSQTLSANLSGSEVTTSDQHNLKWSTKDSDIVQITGITSDGTVSGQSIYITALKSGEALITCSHEKASSDLQFYVVVPGTKEKTITLNKSYITMTKGTSGTQLKATIENAESRSDYANLIWTCDGANGVEVARIMGSGQNVTVYPVTVGEATVTCQLPDSSSVGKCTVLVEAGKSLTFETNSRKVQPFHTKKFNYTVSPPDAHLTWTLAQDDDYFEYRDLGCDSEGNGQVEISGIKEGSGVLACVTDGNAKAQCAVKVAWDYEFSVSGATSFTIEPIEHKKFDFSVSPADSVISVDSTDTDTLFSYEVNNNGDGTGSVTIKPITESPGNIVINIVAKNPHKDYETVGSKSIAAKFSYSKLTPVITQTSRSGNYSNWNNSGNIITIGDGENISLNFGISQEKANGYIENVSFTPHSGYNGYAAVDLVTDNGTNKIYKISNLTGDTVTYEYYISKAYVPYYDGAAILNWKTDMAWYEAHCYHSGGICSKWFGMVSKSHSKVIRCIKDWSEYSQSQPTYYALANCRLNNKNGIIGNVEEYSYNGAVGVAWKYGSHFTKVEDPSYRGKIMDANEFEHIAWFYCCGTRDPYGAWCHRGDWIDECSMDYKYTQFGCDGEELGIKDFIMSENVTATKRTSTDRTVKSLDVIGYLTVKIHHLNTYNTVTIPVQLETRNCPANY